MSGNQKSTWWDLSPVDYSIWYVMQQRVHQSRVKDVDELRECLISVWCELDKSVVNHAIDEWRRRLSACVDAEGGHFEHSLMIATLKITCQNGNTANLIIGDDFFCSLAVNVNEPIAFLTENCYLNLRSKVRTQLVCGKFYYSRT